MKTETKTTNVLFVCTGNIFRSSTSEYLMRKYLEDNKIENINVSSAGTLANFLKPFSETVVRQLYFKIDTKNHEQRKISKDILENQDIIICMTHHHQNSVKDLGFKSILYEEISEGKHKDLMDEEEYGNKNGFDYNVKDYIYSIIDYIHDTMPKIVKYVIEQQNK